MASSLLSAGSTSKWRKIRAAILLRDGHICGWCGGKATEVDHIIPRYLGGEDDESNLISACWDCNRFRDRAAWAKAIDDPEAMPLLKRIEDLRSEITELERQILRMTGANQVQAQLRLDLDAADGWEQLGLVL